MAVPLTEGVVLSKTKVDSLDQVRQLNLWACSLDDLSILKQMPNLEVLCLSSNKITHLRDFKGLRNLTELYLRKNEIADLDEVQHLKGLPKLKILWLSDNPCAGSATYRAYVIRSLPQLEKLDNVDISEEEKRNSARMPQSGFEGPEANYRRGGAPSPRPDAGAAPRPDHYIVTAVLALLNELTPQSLEVIQHDVGIRLKDARK
eukprot:TRINITY_DN2862_c0_g1_i1.p2 TRINITY_DN2862_c0_g1~~TRINITY_DN2862_c0_g1_i1.p2  ORF type:complete len:204 (+),score=58.34 TRINITY_DN2862_c0_g1_i1:273-884(+)